MKLRSDKKLRRLYRSVQELDLDIKAIEEEHDKYRLQGSDSEVMRWFDSLPIETLRESCDYDYGKPRIKYSLHDISCKFDLKRLYDKKSEELEKKQSELHVARIDRVLGKIEDFQDGKYLRRNSRRKKTSG